MRRLTATLLGLTLAALGTAPAADYLTADGKLTETLVLKDLQGGFAGFTGPQVTIRPDGKWEEGDVFRDKVNVRRSGQLTKDQLKKLADELKKYDAVTLKGGSRPTTNPRVVTINYGKHKATLNLPTTGALPKADEKTMPGRFAGVHAAIRAAVPARRGGADS